MARSGLPKGKKIFDYFPEVSKAHMTRQDAIEEYSKLSQRANKRLGALQRTYPKSYISKRYGEGFKPITKGESDTRVFKRLYDVARYLNMAEGSVTGYREARRKQLATLHEHDYKFVNARNLEQFNEFWETVRAHGVSKAISAQSESIAELFEEAKRKRLDPQIVARAFDKYLSKELDMKTVKKKVGAVSGITEKRKRGRRSTSSRSKRRRR